MQYMTTWPNLDIHKEMNSIVFLIINYEKTRRLIQIYFSYCPCLNSIKL